MPLPLDETSAAIIYPAPNVTAVYVSGSTWTAAFREAVAATATKTTTGVAAIPTDPALGFPVADAGANGAPLPWANLDTVSLKLDAAPPAGVTLDSSRVAVLGSTGRSYAVQTFTFDESTLIATLRLATPALNDRLRIELDLETHPGADREIRLNVLPGDIDRSGVVNAADLVLVRNRVGQSARNVAYSIFADLNADGVIAATDLVLTRNDIGTALSTIATQRNNDEHPPVLDNATGV